MLRAVFFDFDGVIVDSEPLHLRAYQAVLQADGIALNKGDYYTRYLGYDDAGLFQALANDRGIAADSGKIDAWIEAKSRIVEEMLSRDSVLFPGAAACVKMFARHVPLGIASGALEGEIAIVLDHAGLRDCFVAIASASDGVRGKPEPDLYMLAMAKLRDRLRGQSPSHADTLDPSTCVAIEDSHWGLAAARKAGLRCVAVTHTYPAADLAAADLVVDGLAELTFAKIAALMRDNGRR
jgi:beta-phosphoglucomutase-like phosphatase (HAD superfamily)